MAAPRTLRDYLDWVIVTPAVPLAAYFCLYTMLGQLAPYLAVPHPAYWILGYLGVCVAWRFWHEGAYAHPIDLVLLAFVGVILASWAATGYAGAARTLPLLAASMLIPWIAVRSFGEDDVRRFLMYVGGFGAAICAAYLLAIPLLEMSGNVWERVTFAGGSAYGIIGPTVGILAVMSGSYLLHEDSRTALVTLFVAVLVMVHMGARGMFVSMFLAFAVLSLMVRSERRRKARVWLVVACASLLASTIIPQARLHHFLRLGMDLEAADRSVNDTIAERLEQFREALQLFLAHPWTGVGAGRFGLETGIGEPLTTPHSTLFHVISELGLAGAVPFAIFNFILLALVWRARTATLPCVVAAIWIYFAFYDQISANYLTSLRYYLFSGLLVTASLAHRIGAPIRQSAARSAARKHGAHPARSGPTRPESSA